MTYTRKMLGTIGAIGTVGWGVLFCIAFLLASRVTGGEMFLSLSPFAVFVFYLVIAIRPCQARTALLVGVVLHLPLVFVVIRLLKLGHESPIYAAALVFGAAVWIIYVRQLARHDNANHVR